MWKQAGIVVVFTFGVFEICEAFFVKWVRSNSLKLRKKKKKEKKVQVGSAPIAAGRFGEKQGWGAGRQGEE